MSDIQLAMLAGVFLGMPLGVALVSLIESFKRPDSEDSRKV